MTYAIMEGFLSDYIDAVRNDDIDDVIWIAANPDDFLVFDLQYRAKSLGRPLLHFATIGAPTDVFLVGWLVLVGWF